MSFAVTSLREKRSYHLEQIERIDRALAHIEGGKHLPNIFDMGAQYIADHRYDTFYDVPLPEYTKQDVWESLTLRNQNKLWCISIRNAVIEFNGDYAEAFKYYGIKMPKELKYVLHRKDGNVRSVPFDVTRIRS